MTLTRRTMMLGAAGAGALGLVACTGTPPAPSGSATATPLTVGLTYIPNVQFAPFYVAAQQGMFTRRGLNVTIRHHGTQEDLFSAMLSGREQVVCASADEAMVAFGTGQPVLTFASFYRTCPVCVIAPKGKASLVGDLRGKRIGVPGRYGSSWYGLLAALSGAGLTESDVVVTEIGWTSVAALLTDKVDAIVGFSNNEPIQFAAKGLATSVIPVVGAASPNLVGPSLVTTKDAASSATLTAVADAVVEAQQAIAADPAVGIAATIKEVPDLAEASAKANAEQVLAASIALWQGADKAISRTLDQPTFARMSDLLVSAGITKSKVDPAAAVLALG